MSQANNSNSDQPYQPDSSPPAFVLVVIPDILLVPDDVLEEVEIFMTQGGDGDGDVGENGVALAS